MKVYLRSLRPFLSSVIIYTTRVFSRELLFKKFLFKKRIYPIQLLPISILDDSGHGYAL